MLNLYAALNCHLVVFACTLVFYFYRSAWLCTQFRGHVPMILEENAMCYFLSFLGHWCVGHLKKPDTLISSSTKNLYYSKHKKPFSKKKSGDIRCSENSKFILLIIILLTYVLGLNFLAACRWWHVKTMWVWPMTLTDVLVRRVLHANKGVPGAARILFAAKNVLNFFLQGDDLTSVTNG